jgi:uncharacterized lipoprotein YddW (UPF0748 family)
MVLKQDSKWLAIGFLLCIFTLGMTPVKAFAQVKTTVKPEKGPLISVTASNVPRPDEGVILYTPDFGDTTRTNPFGVELVAVPFPFQVQAKLHKRPITYKVIQVTQVWACDKKTSNAACGNAAIPPNGIVLSAMGSARKPLLDALPLGSLFQLEEDWFQTRLHPVSVVNPTAENNPMGSAFPGFRAGQQMVVYTSQNTLGQNTSSSTGTNEFGFEITATPQESKFEGSKLVQEYRVNLIEGSDSKISGNNVVLSGHGRARDWLIANCPIGAKVVLTQRKPKPLPEGPDNGSAIPEQTIPPHQLYESLQCEMDLETYYIQLNQRLKDAGGRLPAEVRQKVALAISEASKLGDSGQTALAAKQLNQTLETLNRDLWTYSPAFAPSAIRASWTRPVEKTPQEVRQTLDFLKSAGINTVFLETFFHGYTIFPSKTFEGYGLANNQNPKFKGIDLLKVYVEEAHARGMQVHVWFQDFYVGTKSFEAPGPILSKYPQWANVQYSALNNPAPTPSTLESGGYFMDPANPEARQFLLRLIEETVTRYPVDGFQLDYIRYPASFPPDRFSYLKTTWGYSKTAREAFKTKYGIDPAELTPTAELWPQWNQFKTEQITSFVGESTQLIRRVKPKVVISADVFPRYKDSIVVKHQDWPTWVDRGYLDFIAPMTLTSAVKVVETDLKAVQERINQSGKPIPILAGLFSPFNNNTAEVLLDQIAAAKGSGSQGYAIFDTAHLTGRMVKALAANQKVTQQANQTPKNSPSKGNSKPKPRS